MADIESLINQMRDLYSSSQRVNVNLSEYNTFHKELLEFIYGNHLENTEEWNLISKNLMCVPSEYMVKREGDIILMQLESLHRKILKEKYSSEWELVHPEIARVSKKLYLDGHYASAACDAFIEINDRVKKTFSKLRPNEKVPDGNDAMKKVFSVNNPIIKLSDISTESGYNIQLGYMEMIAGSMSALRNPKAHEIISISAKDAMRQLIFASMLMYKIDEALEKYHL